MILNIPVSIESILIDADSYVNFTLVQHDSCLQYYYYYYYLSNYCKYDFKYTTLI